MAALPLNFLDHVQITITATPNTRYIPEATIYLFYRNVYTTKKFELITVGNKDLEINLKKKKNSNKLYISRKFNKCCLR